MRTPTGRRRTLCAKVLHGASPHCRVRRMRTFTSFRHLRQRVYEECGAYEGEAHGRGLVRDWLPVIEGSCFPDRNHRRTAGTTLRYQALNDGCVADQATTAADRGLHPFGCLG